MRLKFKKLLFLGLLILIAAFTMGIERCATTSANFYYDSQGTYVEITNPPEQCVLYRVIGDTQYLKSGLFVANYAAIKKGFYTADEAIKELDFIEAEVKAKTATVGSVINTLTIVAARASKAGAPEIILLTEGLSPFKGDMTPLDDCTRYKLIAYIGSQRNLCHAFQP